MKKRIVSLALALIMCFSLSVTAFAAENDATYVYDGIAVNPEITKATVSALPESLRLRLLETGNTLESVSTIYYTFENNTMTRADISAADFKLTVTASAITGTERELDMDEYDVYGDMYEFVAIGEWLNDPVYELTDCIAMEWSDDFTFYYHDAYTYSTVWGKKTSNCSLNDAKAELGISYDIDLLLDYPEDEIVLITRVYKPNSSGSANLIARYGHVIYVAGDISVSFGSDQPLQMSVGRPSAIELSNVATTYFNY